jgi:serine/tyrosine/threonine adenylyltransferase
LNNKLGIVNWQKYTLKEDIQRRINEEKGDLMTNSKEIIEIGWNLENSYSRLPKIFFTSIAPNHVHSPNLAILNKSLATDLRYL